MSRDDPGRRWSYKRAPSPSPQRRFDHGKRPESGKGSGRVVLSPNHPAALEGRPLFQGSRIFAEETKWLLKSGHNSRKIGKVVTKGKWRGFPIYTLTLPERETCPRSCEHWLSCYGNHMPFAQRLIPDSDFEEILWLELEGLNAKHPAGYVVRLHILGDFYSHSYVQFWRRALEQFPALRVFGYTARDPFQDEIGVAVRRMAMAQWDRFAIRFSGLDAPKFGAVTIERGAASEHVICPAQTGKTECCATCALCWQSKRSIAFLRH